jgi:hypothetical protein
MGSHAAASAMCLVNGGTNLFTAKLRRKRVASQGGHATSDSHQLNPVDMMLDVVPHLVTNCIRTIHLNTAHVDMTTGDGQTKTRRQNTRAVYDAFGKCVAQLHINIVSPRQVTYRGGAARQGQARSLDGTKGLHADRLASAPRRMIVGRTLNHVTSNQMSMGVDKAW